MPLFLVPHRALPRPDSCKGLVTVYPAVCMCICLPLFLFFAFLFLLPRANRRHGAAPTPSRLLRPSSAAGFGFHSPGGRKFLFPVRSVTREGWGFPSLPATSPGAGAGGGIAARSQSRDRGPGTEGRTPRAGHRGPVRGQPHHDGGGEEEPAVLQAVHREDPEPHLHPEQHDGVAVGR